LGVMPAWFQVPLVNDANFDEHNDVWIPVPPSTDEQGRTNGTYSAYARLKPGVTLAQARADAKAIAAQLVKENPKDYADTYTSALFGLRDFVALGIRPYLLLFIAAAVLLLLVTWANVSGLLIARSVGRAHEIAVRAALGARRTHLALQFVFEGGFISIPAAALGLLASVGLTRLALSLATEHIPRASEIKVDGAVVLFVAVLTCFTAILPSLGPLWQAVRMPPAEVLTDGVRASASARTRNLSRSLVVAETAFAFLLLAVSGVLIFELNRLRHTSPGFEVDHLLTFQLDVSGDKFASPQAQLAHQNSLISALEAVPGVSGAATIDHLPLDGCCLTTSFEPEGEAVKKDFLNNASPLVVSPDYFHTMGIPLDHGRLLNATDGASDGNDLLHASDASAKNKKETLLPVVIDEAAASRFWPNRDALGQYAKNEHLKWARLQVVGVVGDVRNRGLGAGTWPELYFPESVDPLDEMGFVLRSPLPTATLLPSIRDALRKIDPDHSIYSVRTMEEIAENSLTTQRLSSAVVGFFALAAFLLASLGIYGVMSYSVRERTVEIGTRMAIGAMPRDLLRMVIGDGLRMAAYGILIGIPAAAAATWLVMHYLQVHHLGALPYVASAALVGGVAIAASLFPAWRATLLSPMVAIRNESESLWTAGRRSLAQTFQSGASKNEASALDPALFTGFIDASRRADSFSQALAIALEDLRKNLRSQSAMLFENAGASEAQYRLRAASPQMSDAQSIPAGGFLPRRLRFNTFPIAFAADEMGTVLRWAREQKPQHISEIEFLKAIGVRLAAPLRTKSDIIGVLLLGAPVGRDSYTPADRELVQLCAQQLALMIENARLTDRVVEQEKIRRDVALAAEVQERLLPEKSIEDGSVSIAAFTLPARGVGGDCHDFLELGNHEIGIALADVSGKGIAAALIMAAIQASLRILTADKEISPAELASRMNSFLYRSTGFDRYATFFYVQLNSEKRRLRYVNAGHNPPFLMRVSQPANGESPANIEELRTGGTVIGMFPSADYEEAQVELRPGDVMLAFTDGVSEALNTGQEEFGEARLKNLLTQVAHLPVKEMLPLIAQELRSWIGTAPQHDDMTFIIAKID
jgi:predicted permease